MEETYICQKTATKNVLKSNYEADVSMQCVKTIKVALFIATIGQGLDISLIILTNETFF